jgi:hypothetical protein
MRIGADQYAIYCRIWTPCSTVREPLRGCDSQNGHYGTMTIEAIALPNATPHVICAFGPSVASIIADMMCGADCFFGGTARPMAHAMFDEMTAAGKALCVAAGCRATR